MKKKFKSLQQFDEIAVPSTIIKIKPFIYGTSELSNPNCEVSIRCDIWITDGLPNPNIRANKKIQTKYIAKAVIDLENRKILTSKDEEIHAENIDIVFDLIEQRINGDDS
jgi:hypothetical protein